MFEGWPYTNFHDLNLNWLISKWKMLEDNLDDIHASMDAAEESANKAWDAKVEALIYQNKAKDYRDDAQGFANDASQSALDAANEVDSITGVVDLVYTDSARISSLIANAGDGTIPSELLDIRIGYDGYTYTTAGDAVRAQAVRTNGVTETFPGYISTNGEYTAPTTNEEIYTNPIPVLPGSTLDVHIEWTSAASKWVAYQALDVNGAHLSRTVLDNSGTFTSKDYTITVPSNCYYIRITYRSLGDPIICSARFVGSIEELMMHLDSVKQDADHLPEINKWSVGILDANGTYVVGNRWVSDVVEIPLQSYTIWTEQSTTNLYHKASFYDKDGNYLSQTVSWTLLETKPGNMIAAPADAAFMRLQVTKNWNNIPGNLPDVEDRNTVRVIPGPVPAQNDYTWRFSSHIKGINHRGFSAVAPENTIPAYIMSKQAGFSYVECDVSMTADRVPVLLHDSTINRTARNLDGTTITDPTYIGDLTYSDLANFDFGIWKGDRFAGTACPSLEEFIIACKALGLKPYVELKQGGGYTQQELHDMLDMVKYYGMEEETAWISFSGAILWDIRNYNPNVRLGFVASPATDAAITSCITLKTGTNNVFLDTSTIAMTDAQIERCMENDIGIELWTYDNPSDYASMRPEISGVTSNYNNAEAEFCRIYGVY